MSRMNSRSISRRSFVTAAVTAAAATGGVADVLASRRAPVLLRLQGSGNLPTPREQTLVMVEGTNNIWDSFNPFIPNGEQGGYGLIQTCRESLFYANYLTGETRPWLAQEYTYNPDFTECTLKLTPGVTWSDGRPYTADDVVFTQTMLLENPQLNGAADAIADIKSLTATDPQTVVFTLAAPNTRFHYRFVAGTNQEAMRVVPKHIWDGQDPGTFTFNPPVYTGPYTLQEASSSKLYFLWAKNPSYWNKANLDPKPQYVIYQQAGPVDTQVQEFLAGNLDMAHQGVGFDYLNQQVVEAQYEQTSRFDFPDPCPRGMYFNAESPTGLFATPEGRQAVSLLLNREVIATTIWQPPSRAATMPWADYEAWNAWATPEVIGKYDLSYNVERANQLLDGLGSTREGDIRTLDGKPLQLSCITPVPTTGLEYQIGSNLATSAREAGIEIAVRSAPGSAFGDAFSTGQYDLTSHWLCGMQFDPNQLYRGFHSRNYFPVGERANRGGDAGNTRFRNAELDAAIEQMEAADPTDAAARPAFDKGLDLFMAQAPAVPIIQTIYPMMFSTAYWTGWPTAENPYTIPATWWSHFLFAIGSLQPAAAS